MPPSTLPAFIRAPVRGAVLLVLVAGAACGLPGRGTLSSTVVPSGCGEATMGVDDQSLATIGAWMEAVDVVDWVRPRSPEARAELAPWCKGVAPPLVYRPPRDAWTANEAGGEVLRSSAGTGLEGLAVISWNVNVGAGDLDRLVEDLRTGRLTGRPSSHFVLLLQEVFSRRTSVPTAARGEIRAADRIGEPSERRARSEIEAVARRRGLHLIYVPSMRNGDPADGGPPEDRGNAILSTLPLFDHQAVELPLQAQRRVAVAATVHIADVEGRSRDLRVVSVHLDHHSGWSRIYRSFGADRARHAALLVEAFREEELIVLGGDFNTWFGEGDEPAVEVIRAHFPLPEDRPEESTLEVSLFPDRLVDHLFVRLPSGWATRYRIAEDGYGSDHRPLVGWVGAVDGGHGSLAEVTR